MKALELLSVAIKIERKAADIYRLLHDRFREDEMASYLWYSLSMEEEGHAAFIEAEMNMLNSSPDAFGETTVDVAPILASLKMMEDAERDIRGNPVTLEKAVSLALKIEEEMVEKKYGNLVEIVSPSLKRVFSDLIEMSDHVELLNDFAKKMGIRCL